MVIRVRSLLAAALVLSFALAGCTTPSATQSGTARAIAPSPSVAACDPVPGAGFPPLLTGFDPRLSTAPVDNGARTVPTDLTVTVLIQGTCAKVVKGQRIAVNYVGLTLADGEVFDSSWTRKEAFEPEIGVGHLIEGFDRGLIGVAVGSRVQLDIPANLAYGDNAAPGQPKGALRYIVDVLSAQA